jgi:hypothetical protein
MTTRGIVASLRRGVFALFAFIGASSVSAQADPSGHWRTLHTAHFRVHFQPAYRAVAQEAAREAERAYGLLAAELHPPRGVVDLVLADNTDAGNGLATTYPSNRMTVWLAPPATDPGLQNYDSWLRLVIVHELAHVFHLDRSRGLWGALQSVFGRAPGLFPNEYQPTWVVEGLATYYESRFTGAGRLADGFHDQLLGAAGAAARSPWDALSFTRWPDGFTPYAYGARFLNVMSARVGDSLVPRLIEGAAGQLIPYRIGRPLRRAAGRDVLAEWPAATRIETPRGDSEVIARGLRSPPVPRLAPDGRRIAYLHDDGKAARRLRVATIDGWRTTHTRSVTGGVSYDWAGDTIVIVQLDFTGRRRLRSDLYRWVPATGKWSRGTRGARLTEPRLGGFAIALTPGDNAPILGGETLPDSPGTTWGDVVPAPDGRYVAATRHQDGRWTLVRWPAGRPDSSAVLFAPGGLVADPVWSAAGSLFFVATVAGLPQIFRWDDGVGTAAPVTHDPQGARHPAALPDGSLLYTSLGTMGWELRRVRPLSVGAPSPAPTPQPPAFDSAPPVAVRESRYAAWPSLRPHFWIPAGVNAGVAGQFFGAATVGVDAVGRTAYLLQGLVAANPWRGAGTFVVVSEALGNPTLDASASNGWSAVGTASTGHEVSAESRDAGMGATFVQRRWRRTASLRVAAEYEGDRFVSVPDTAMAAVCTGCRRRDFVGGSLSVGLAHFVAAPLSISAQDGFSWSLTYRRREEQASTRWSDELRTRLAVYLRLPVGGGGRLARPVMALRVAAGAAQGPARRTFSVGGVSSGTFDLGLGLAIGSSRLFPVRGYPSGAVRGMRAASAAAELRVPLALVGRGIGHLPLGMDKFSIALFADAGDAWNAGAEPRLTRLLSGGMELVGDLTINYGFPLRARLGVAQPRSGSTQAYFVFGSDF